MDKCGCRADWCGAGLISGFSVEAPTLDAEQFVQSLRFDECQPTVEEDSIVRFGLVWCCVVLCLLIVGVGGRLRRSRFGVGELGLGLVDWVCCSFVRSFVACRLPGMVPVDGTCGWAFCLFFCCCAYLCLILYLTQIAVGLCVRPMECPGQTRPDQTR